MSSPVVNNPSITFPELRKFLEGKSHHEVLRYCLGLDDDVAPTGSESIVVIVIDTEHHVYEPRVLTEVGFHTFTRTEMKATLSNPGVHGENMLKAIWYYHLRPKHHAHYINRRHCPADPEKNLFGNTRFVTNSQAKEFLDASFGWPVDDQRPGLGTCPVVVLGHSITNDTCIFGDFNVAPKLRENVVRYIDTQVIADSNNIHGNGHRIGLEVLTRDKMGIEFRHGHTASNDAAYTIFAGLWMVMKPAEFAKGNENVTRQEVVDRVAAFSKDFQPGFGLANFCTRCGGTNHKRGKCKNKVFCKKCDDAGNEKAARTHATQMCTRQ